MTMKTVFQLKIMEVFDYINIYDKGALKSSELMPS